jgi:predicted GIY-YIG superfamily endonuclease
MELNDLKIAYDIVSKFNKYDTLSTPPKVNTLNFKVPIISGIHQGEHRKNIEEVKPNTLEYILYYLHNIDFTMIINTLIALLYYWKFRKRKSLMMKEVYQEIVNHFTVHNEPYKWNEKTKKGNCVYIIKIEIGNKVLYKVGKTKDLHQRMLNLQSNINANYSFVSVGITIKEVLYCDNHAEKEKILLTEIRNRNIKKHKFYFKGHTECFESDILFELWTKMIQS